MPKVSPVSAGSSPARLDSADRTAFRRDAARNASEVSNGERNAQATAAEFRRLQKAAPRQDGVGGSVDLVG